MPIWNLEDGYPWPGWTKSDETRLIRHLVGLRSFLPLGANSAYLNDNEDNVDIIEDRVNDKSYVGRERFGLEGIRVKSVCKDKESQIKVALEEIEMTG
jgi:hypothetical protein